MKPRNPFPLLCVERKSINKMIALPFILLSFLISYNNAGAQCGAGYNQVTLNWDYLDYFSYSGFYTTTAADVYLASNTQAQTQNFAFGTQRVVITNNYTGTTNLGEDATHTGDAGSYAVGNVDVHFIGNGQITLTFENEVNNLKFSMFDIDRNQKVAFSATNALGVAQNVTITRLGTSILTTLLNGTALANVSASSSTPLNTVADASMNVDVAGPVKTITINITNTGTNGSEDGSFWLSNIIACSAGTFPSAYHIISKPFTNQPGYVLSALDKSIYAVNPANGVSKLLFTDPGGNINSMGYDPYNRILYYVYSLTGSAGTNTALKAYNFNTKTISTVLADVRTIGIPLVTLASSSIVYASGVESGAGSFYNGSFYLGIEATNKNGSGILGTSNREAIIWRIDFDASNVPYRSSQVFALPNDNGTGTLMHDWSDFVITNGILYDFDGAGVTTKTDIYHFDMMNGTAVNYPLPLGWTPGQPVVGWNESVYQLYATTAAPAVNPYVALYNGNGTIGTRFNLTSAPMFTPAIPSVGDGAEAFRPLADFGDAPASYDPVTGDPAVHELDFNLRMGTAESEEWVTRGQSTLANADNFEDGIGAAANLNFNGTVTYTVNSISLFNNTGSPAVLIGWLDYNVNGVFDPGEGRVSASIPSSTSTQFLSLTWTGIFVPTTAALKTFLRLRITKIANGMTTANATGYMPDGEVEDYPVVMGINLPVEITGFDLQKGNGKTAMLNWSTSGNMADNAAFDIERSADGLKWNNAGTVNTSLLQVSTDKFSYKDENALPGKSYYRIKTVSKDGTFKYTGTKSVVFSYIKGKITVSPNPVTDYITVQLSADHAAPLKIALYDHSGKTVYEKSVPVAAGDNSIRLTDVKNILPGMYYIKLNIGDEIFTDKLVVVKN
ncbi:MAG: GEVED domain-containing protein [Chitinophagaceae bacterium]